jgi:hypothetical protein
MLFSMATTLDEDWAVEARSFEEALGIIATNAALPEEIVGEARELANVEQTVAAEGDE